MNQEENSIETQEQLEYKSQVKKIFRAIRASIPKDILPEVSEWAEKNRFMTTKVSKLLLRQHSLCQRNCRLLLKEQSNPRNSYNERSSVGIHNGNF